MRLRGGLVLLLIAAGSRVACSHPCNESIDDDSSSADLSVMESSESASVRGMLGGSATRMHFDVLRIYTSLDGQQGETGCSTGPCAVVQSGDGAVEISIIFHLPDAAGTFRLEDLEASVCDRACARIAGMLSVGSITHPCADHSCGAIDASMTIDSAIEQSGPTITGQAHLAHVELLARESCPNQILPAGG
jgi:hypothetical protein